MREVSSAPISVNRLDFARAYDKWVVWLTATGFAYSLPRYIAEKQHWVAATTPPAQLAMWIPTGTAVGLLMGVIGAGLIIVVLRLRRRAGHAVTVWGEHMPVIRGLAWACVLGLLMGVGSLVIDLHR